MMNGAEVGHQWKICFLARFVGGMPGRYPYETAKPLVCLFDGLTP